MTTSSNSTGEHPVGRPTPVTAATVTQRPSGMPIHKYGPYEAVDIPDRTADRPDVPGP
jgi:2-isopropylmalate synthase